MREGTAPAAIPRTYGQRLARRMHGAQSPQLPSPFGIQLRA